MATVFGRLFQPLRTLWRGADAAPAPADASAPTRGQVERALTDAGGPAAGYKPQLPFALWTGAEHGLPPIYRYYLDLPAMLLHTRVTQALGIYKSGVAGAKIPVEASSPAVQQFAERLLERFWLEWLDQTHKGYDWGWCGCDVRYTDENGLFTVAAVEAYEPQDVTPLEREGSYVGFRVRRVSEGTADLWGPGVAPARGFWYCHRPTKGMFHGFSQCYPSWQPWRRLAGRDGAQEVIDGGVYRYAYAGVVVRYPDRDERSSNPPAGGSVGGRIPYRDMALAFAEGAKAGVNVALPSNRDPTTKELEWDAEFPNHVLDVDPLINYVGWVEKAIDAGIGVPSELIEAAETGSGYSGRMIPLEAFFLGQQSVATSIVRQVMQQIVLPLVRWNFGRGAWARAKVEPLLQTRRQASGPQQAGEPGQPPPGSEPADGEEAAGVAPSANGDGGQEKGQWYTFNGPKGGRWKRNSVTGSIRHMATAAPTGSEVASTQLDVPPGLARRILALAARIPDDDLHEKGREGDPHLTVRYGLKASSEEVAATIRSFGPIDVRLGRTGFFPADESGGEFDVVYVEVMSPRLVELNAKLGDLPHKDTHADYTPHITLAYVQPGQGVWHAGDEDLEGDGWTADELIYSDPDRHRDRLPLANGHRLSTATPDGPDDGKALADWYAETLTLMLRAGVRPDADARERIAAEVRELGYRLRRTPGGYLADPLPEGAMMSTRHAPPGGIVIGGRLYKGGQFIPNEGALSRSDKAKLNKAESASKAKLRAKGTTPDSLRTKLAPHAKELAPAEQTKAKRAFAQLRRHHGDDVHHRLGQIADGLQEALDAAPADEEGLRAQLASRLAQLHAMAGWASPAPAKAAAPTPAAKEPAFAVDEAAPPGEQVMSMMRQYTDAEDGEPGTHNTSLADLRDMLPHLSRDQFDAALMGLHKSGTVRLIQKSIPGDRRDWDGGIKSAGRPGEEPMLTRVEFVTRAESPTPAPAKPAAPAPPAPAPPKKEAPKHTPASALAQAYDHAVPFATQGLVELPKMKQHFEKAIGKPVAMKDFHALLAKAWEGGGIEMHIRNEVRDLTPEQRAATLERNGKAYYYVLIRNRDKLAAR